ncbi:DUF3560 domain-containing protein [Sorangium sp. So ce693]|uniref:DUF3560 domain-containing protein n=1 Tax=Sorangium sp. So ce693 TaxID=3133318 RepID=UPI003F60FC65
MGSHRFSRKELRQQISREDRNTIKDLRAQIRQLRAGANEEIKKAREACLLSKRPQLDDQDARFNETVKSLRADRRAVKKQIKSPCNAPALRGILAGPHDPASIPEYLRGAVEPFRAHHDKSVDLKDRLRVQRAEKVADTKQRPRRTAGERLSEANDLALQNIPEHLHGLWNQIKGSLRANRHRARWEAFLDWVDANPSEVATFHAQRQASTQAQLDRELAEEQARRAETERAQRELEAEIEQDERRPPPVPKGRGWKLSMVKGKKVESVHVLRHPSLEERAERAALEDRLWLAWRVGELEILQEQLAGPGSSVIHVSQAGGPVETFEMGGRTTRQAVEGWLKAKEAAAKAAQPKPSKQPKSPKQPRKGRGARGRTSTPPPVRILQLPPPLRVLALPAHMPEEPARPLADARADEESALRALDEVNEDVEVAGTHIEEVDGWILLRFREKPCVAIRERLKTAGFRWWEATISNQHGAWRAPASDRARQVAIAEARAFAETSPAASAHEEKRRERIERMKGRAARERRRAESTYQRARQLGEVIPLGQPILVGHHSEGRDRRYRDKIRRTYDEAFKGMNRAEELERRAAAAERNTAISSDDPDAIVKLKAKREALEEVRALLPQAQKVLKTSKDRNAARAALAALGFAPVYITRLTPDPPLDRWAVSTVRQNTTGELTRLRRRIEELEQRAAAPRPAAAQFGDARIYEEDNRVRIRFEDGKPPKALRERLGGHGFRWAPSIQVWQRKASTAAWYWARQILKDHAGKASCAAGSGDAEACCAECGDPPPVATNEGTALLEDSRRHGDGGELKLEPTSPAPKGTAVQASRPSTAQERTSSLFGAGGPVPPAPAPDRQEALDPTTTPDWRLTSWERTGSLFGPAGPVPPPPGERNVPSQTRLRFM